MPISEILSPSDVTALWDAADFSLQLEKPLTAFITLVWQHVGITDQATADKAFAAFTTKLRRWCTDQGGYYAVWVAENSPDRGYHHHVITHVPRSQIPALRRSAEAWMPSSTNPQRSHALDVRTHWPNVQAANVHRGLLRYVSKATDYAAELVDTETGELVNLAALLGIEPREGKALSGLVHGKRRGWSENLGAAARSRAEFRSRFERYA